MSKKIKTISFLADGQRIYVHATKFGRFKIPMIKTERGMSRTVNRVMSPREVVENEQIRNGDPTLTLENGDKIRVYQGGDPSYMISHAKAILDLHEESSRASNNAWLNKPKPRAKKKTNKTIIPDNNNYDIFQDIMNWDDADTD